MAIAARRSLRRAVFLCSCGCHDRIALSRFLNYHEDIVRKLDRPRPLYLSLVASPRTFRVETSITTKGRPRRCPMINWATSTVPGWSARISGFRNAKMTESCAAERTSPRYGGDSGSSSVGGNGCSTAVLVRLRVTAPFASDYEHEHNPMRLTHWSPSWSQRHRF